MRTRTGIAIIACLLSLFNAQVVATFGLEPTPDPAAALAAWQRQVEPLRPALAKVMLEEAGTPDAFRARALMERLKRAVDQAGAEASVPAVPLPSIQIPSRLRER